MNDAITSAPDGALIVEDVAKYYGRTKAVDGVSLRVDRGKFVALLGQNGAGKTTLFQLVTGLFVADRGEIHINGYNIRRDAPAALGSLGVVFQQPTLDLELTVMANLQFHARLHGMNRSRMNARIADELDRLGLAQRAQEKTRLLSGGLRRRVELARALLHDPPFLLMDEATVGLDPATRRQMLVYVNALCKERGVGVLWSTHLVEEAEQAEQVIVLHHGRVMLSDTPEGMVRTAAQTNLTEAFLSLTAGNPEPS